MDGFVEKCHRAYDKRKWLLDHEKYTNSYRLVNGDGDSLQGITVDRYGEYLLVQSYEHYDSLLIAKNVEKTLQALWFPVKGVLFKDRTTLAGGSDVCKSIQIFGEIPHTEYVVRQNGVDVSVDLINGINTGLFLDMREVRNELASVYPKGSLLNLFSYTAVFSIHAIQSGMEHAINVDVARSVHEKAIRNYSLNKIRIDMRNFVADSSSDYLKYALKKGLHFSMVIMDPPTFARSKRGSFSVKTDYVKHLEMIEKLDPQYVYTVINTHTISVKEYTSMHPVNWIIEKFWHESSDFTHEGDGYLKSALWRIRK